MKPVSAQKTDSLIAALYFLAGTLLTWWFIEAGDRLYSDRQKMLLSCAIAGGKWAIQIAAAFILLQERRWKFIRGIAGVCLVGSLILLPFCFSGVQNLAGPRGFLYSLIASVAVMIGMYYRVVRQAKVSPRWFWAWIGCLAVAISLQLTVVFDVL